MLFSFHRIIDNVFMLEIVVADNFCACTGKLSLAAQTATPHSGWKTTELCSCHVPIAFYKLVSHVTTNHNSEDNRSCTDMDDDNFKLWRIQDYVFLVFELN